jgi:replication-associated recombination protein RarA
MTTLFENEAPHPLADRLRPRRLADIVGQDHLLGPEGPIGRMVASRQLASMILWGPPGCGKTTFARPPARPSMRSSIQINVASKCLTKITTSSKPLR